jgi:hypothetical protein
MAGNTIPVNLSVSTTTVVKGQSVTLTWNAPAASSCSGVNFVTGGSTSGNLSLTPEFTAPYIIVCQNGSGGSGSGIAIVTVSSIPNPDKFSLNDRIQTTAKVKVKTSPSTTASSAGTQQKGNTGTVIGGPVIADGYTWWNINYDKGADGWTAENYLLMLTDF